MGLDQNFHDVTLVDMGDVPESSVSIPELSSLRQLWPPAVLSHMVWLQQELEGCIGMWQSFTWTWHNCGGVRCLGALCGKTRHKIVWMMFGGRMMFRGTLSRPVLNSFSRRGQSDVMCGRIP